LGCKFDILRRRFLAINLIKFCGDLLFGLRLACGLAKPAPYLALNLKFVLSLAKFVANLIPNEVKFNINKI